MNTTPRRLLTPPAGLIQCAEFYLSLARAFVPPQEAAAYYAIKLHPADDLGEIAAALNYPAANDLGNL